MATLITGGAGYIGSHMAHALADRGEALVVLDNLSTGFAQQLPPAARLEVGDIGDAGLLARIFGNDEISAVVHFAGSIVVPDSVRDPLGYYENNTVKSRTLIEAAVKAGVEAFIFSSTAAVYGEPDDAQIGEDASLKPVSPYGRSKLMTEWMLADAAAAHDLRYVALRYFNVAGADPAGRTGQSTPNATHLIKVAAQAALGMRQSFSIFGDDYPTPDGTCRRDFIHVSDLIAAHVLALEHLRGGGASTVFNCGYGEGYSVLEVVEAVKRVSGVDFAVERAPRRPGDPSAIIANADRIRAELGWQPQHADLDTIVRHALSWEDRLRQEALLRNDVG